MVSLLSFMILLRFVDPWILFIIKNSFRYLLLCCTGMGHAGRTWVQGFLILYVAIVYRSSIVQKKWFELKKWARNNGFGTSNDVRVIIPPINLMPSSRQGRHWIGIENPMLLCLTLKGFEPVLTLLAWYHFCALADPLHAVAPMQRCQVGQMNSDQRQSTASSISTSFLTYYCLIYNVNRCILELYNRPNK